MKKTKKAGDLMKQQLAKAVEIGVETVNYWIISYALSSMAMIFRADIRVGRN